MTRIVVTGRVGQLATALAERAAGAGVELLALGRPVLDLRAIETVSAALLAATPDVIVSAAAYTQVDRAEAEPDMAFAVNRDGAGAVAQAARALGVPVIHISTDYVFDGNKPTPYAEEDSTNPLSVYGASKLKGEEAVRAATPDHAILRTSWIYSPFGDNFLKTMLRLARERAELRVVADQQGCPTSALDIADAVLAIALALLQQPGNADLRGTFHLAGCGGTSRAEFAEEIFRLSGRLGGPQAEVVPITTAEYPTPARRPSNSRLSTQKLETLYGVALPDWRTSTAYAVDRLLQQATLLATNR